jgi:hypothetical protein
VFSVSSSNIPRVKIYIDKQEAHHRKRRFQDEYRAFLDKDHVAFEERFVWD